MKHYIGKAKFELKNELGEKMIVGPDSFDDIPDSFQGDPTYKMAVAAGVIQPFITVKEGDKAQEKANAKGGRKATKPRTRAAPAVRKPRLKIRNGPHVLCGACCGCGFRHPNGHEPGIHQGNVSGDHAGLYC